MKTKLCLGTAQFGLNYGITNLNGKPRIKEIDLIIENALKNNIFHFDTANAYGDSERILGNKLNNKHVKFITKFNSGVKNSFSKEAISKLDKNFELTLKSLKTNNIDSLLLHDAKDMTKRNNHLLLNWLHRLRSKGKVNRVGISIYEETDLENIPLNEIEIVQMPVSIYDQRLLKNSFINKLLENNISIHVRSIFLQGLLLQNSKKWPKHINESFLNHHISYEKELSSKSINFMDAALSFIKNLKFPELVIFGVTNNSELKTIIESWNCKKSINNKLDFKSFKWDIKEDIDPRSWRIKNF
tara:strand:- start:314 stop:1213 length:900 start_codon:yes stop_codon:yes gene_type:complete